MIVLAAFNLSIRKADLKRLMNLTFDEYGVLKRFDFKVWSAYNKARQNGEEAFLDRMAALGVLECRVISWELEGDAYYLTPLGLWLRENH